MPMDDPTRPLLDGRYRLGECVGRGGMARVYRAQDVVLGRTVAIKTWDPDAEGAVPGRPHVETSVLASLDHPALVTLFDAQLAPGRAQYIVMEMVEGSTLAARIAEGPLSSSEAAALAVDLSEALQVVHGAGIVHRDIKPSNVLLSDAPRAGRLSGAKLADFGISALIGADRVTSPGMLLGTAAYLAPEQVRGAPPAPSADIYSFALVLLEALTGQRAFPEAEGIGTAFARLEAAPSMPEGLDPAWVALLSQMTAMEPEARPAAADVTAAASTLLPAFAGRRPSRPAGVGSSSAAPVTSPTRVITFGADAGGVSAMRMRTRVIGAAAGVLVAAAVTGVWVAGGWTDEDASRSPVETERTVEPAPTSTSVAEVDTDQPAVVPAGEEETAGAEEATSGGEPGSRKAGDTASKDAEKAAKEAQKEAEKARKDAEKAARDRAKETGTSGKGPSDGERKGKPGSSP